jgi:hypothetical protein
MTCDGNWGTEDRHAQPKWATERERRVARRRVHHADSHRVPSPTTAIHPVDHHCCRCLYSLSRPSSPSSQMWPEGWVVKQPELVEKGWKGLPERVREQEQVQRGGVVVGA